MKQFIIILLFTIMIIGNQNCTNNSNSINENMLKKIASELNKTYPQMLDKDTRLDYVTVPQKNTFQYNYTLINHSKNNLNLRSLKTNLRNMLFYKIKHSDKFQSFRDNKTTVNFSYRDKNGVFLFSFQFKYEDYMP